MDHAQAERDYAALQARLEAGTLGKEAYREALNALRVTDERGRVWMMQEGSGRWYVWENGAWQAAEPPRPASAPPPPPPVAPQPGATRAAAVGVIGGPTASAAPVIPGASAAVAAAPVVAMDRGTNAAGFILAPLLWAVGFGALTYIAVNNGGLEQEQLLVLVGVAVFALALILWRLTRHYEGVIERVRVEQVTDTDDDGTTSTRNIMYAYVRTADNKVKKINARRGFAQGDRIYKRKGDWSPRKESPRR